MTLSVAQDPDPLIGRTVERYRIERELGRGAMGVVYEARHEDLAKRAAVKTILPHALADEVARSRFVREATALGRVKSPGLVDIYNVGSFEGGTPYILMEMLDGPTLSEHLKQAPGGRLTIAESLRLVQQLASTLADLHNKGVVHRDLKPDKITHVEKWLSDFLILREKCGEVISDASRDTVLPSFSCEQAHTCNSTRWLVRTSASFGRSSRLRHGDAPSSASSHHSVVESGFRRIRVLRRCGLVARVSGSPTSVP